MHDSGSVNFRRGRIFGDIIKASFIRRPNRFTAECDIGGRRRRAYLPNPGRLRELLLPGAELLLTTNPVSAGRSTHYTVAAVRKEGIPVMLHTHHSNTVAGWLIETGKIPGLEGYRILRREVVVGRSRFDFLLERDRKEFLLEVKSCTLFGNDIAMFPDAVTLRGRRHLLELSELSDKGRRGGVIFLVHWPLARYFMPDYHTDLEFAKTLAEVRRKIFVKAVGLQWDECLTPSDDVKELVIPWSLIEEEVDDRGNYILILRLERSMRFAAGGLEKRAYPRGYYIYVGSAMRNLAQRMERHRHRRKRVYWHIDYLRDRAVFIEALPVRSSRQLECAVAGALRDVSDWTVPGFGSTDCSCEAHLFGMRENPLSTASFLKVLQHYRIDRLSTFLT